MYLTTKGEPFHEIADMFYKNQGYWTFTRIRPQLTTDNNWSNTSTSYWGQRTIEPSGRDERPAQGQRWPLPPKPLLVPKSHSAHLRCTALCQPTPAPLFLSLCPCFRTPFLMQLLQHSQPSLEKAGRKVQAKGTGYLHSYFRIWVWSHVGWMCFHK